MLMSFNCKNCTIYEKIEYICGTLFAGYPVGEAVLQFSIINNINKKTRKV